MRTMAYPSNEFERIRLLNQETPASIRRSVAAILEKVRVEGDRAVSGYTQQFDGLKLSPGQFRIKTPILRSARVTKAFQRSALQTLHDVEVFAKASLPKNWRLTNSHGGKVGEKFDPLARVGVYIPGGSVPLVSTVFMTVALARSAGVKEIVACTPPPASETILWALHECGATEVYQIGGAQAMAAMAFGTRTISKVDKLFGPGNSFVTEAKRQLFGKVGIDLLAGPSELMVLADETTQVDWAALDLLAQAEHGSGRERVFCVSTSERVLQTIHRKMMEKAEESKNKGLWNVLNKGIWFIRTRSRESMSEVANHLAPEHLEIMTRKPQDLAEKIHTAGGIFLGNWTPTVLGDFVAGPSHTLPTAGAGRSFSGLRVSDFMRRTSVIEYSKAAVARARDGVEAFAQAENLPFHGESLRKRHV